MSKYLKVQLGSDEGFKPKPSFVLMVDWPKLDGLIFLKAPLGSAHNNGRLKIFMLNTL